MATSKKEILNDPEFKKLVSQKNAISWVLTILELVLYFGFISLIAFNKPFLAQKWGDGSATTIGIPIAVGTIALSWVFTGIYIWWANTRYDQMVKNLRERTGG
ncbi:MAG: hypothetical protein A2010_12985 [Nitrospirae bacterium GWD2_57_9]|nr:MAG: hypothetical protein A2010_12985 [Nitrospirae bacterium GWD2_57_9]